MGAAILTCTPPGSHLFTLGVTWICPHHYVIEER